MGVPNLSLKLITITSYLKWEIIVLVKCYITVLFEGNIAVLVKGNITV